MKVIALFFGAIVAVTGCHLALAKEFTGMSLFQGQWSDNQTLYSNLEVDLVRCQAFNRGIELMGDCMKISDNLIVIVSPMQVQAFTTDDNGDFITVLLRDLSDGSGNVFSSVVVGVERASD